MRGVSDADGFSPGMAVLEVWKWEDRGEGGGEVGDGEVLMRGQVGGPGERKLVGRHFYEGEY